MRVLFYIEPVIFWEKPSVLTAHLVWPSQFEAALQANVDLTLMSNLEVCEAWQNQSSRKSDRKTLVVDSYRPLAAFDWNRAAYSRSLYLGGTNAALTAAFEDAREKFRPDIVVASSQSAFFDAAFADLPRIYVEQAFLPRHGQPFRTGFDPRGHQVGALLEHRAADIRDLAISPDQAREASLLLDQWTRWLQFEDQALSACASLLGISQGQRIALFATQPPDWSTYEGAFRQIDVQGLLCSWESQLPAGWIGVPTYHPGYRLPAEVEASLSRSCPRLRFLPPEFAQGLTEPLLTAADALVSISSTCSVTALLLGKAVAVVGRSPFCVWGTQKIADIESVTPLSREQRLRLLVFLTHRVSRTRRQLDEEPNWLVRTVEQRMTDNGEGDWQLDVTTWSAVDAKSSLHAKAN